MPKHSSRSPITIVLTLEGLATAGLGCYGCSWNETPTINTMAANGVVWDRWTSPIDRPGGLIMRWLDGCRSVVRELGEQGGAVFLSDDRQLTLDDGFGFDSVHRLEPTVQSMPAETMDATALSQSFTAAINAVQMKTRLLWLHSGAMRDHWDAPLLPDDDVEEAQEPHDESSMEQRIVSVEPFRLPLTTLPPGFQLSDADDPDLLFAWMSRYAAQIQLLDQLIAALSDTMRDREMTIVLAGTSGFSLGENGWVGHHVGPLRSQDVRLPLLVSSGGPLRVPYLQTAAELPALLSRLAHRVPLITPAQWCQSNESAVSSVQTDSDRAAKAITTTNWFYVDDAVPPNAGEARLYVKPDDVNDINDIARLRGEVLTQFAEALPTS